MITDILFSIIMTLFVFFGLKRPHIALAGVIWVDTITPQLISSSFLLGKPMSFMLTLAFFISITINVKKLHIPKQKSPHIMLGLLLLWMWLSTQQAHYPEIANWKFSLVFKILILAAFIPLVLDSRMKLELFLWIFVASVSFYLHISGIKALAGGGGYSVDVIQTSSENSGITETSTLSIMSAIMLPLIAYLYQHSLIAKEIIFVKSYLLITAFTAVFSVIGTFARSGLITILFVTLMLMSTSSKKFRMIFIVAASVFIILPLLPSGWSDRMNTIKSPDQDQSASARILVWRWTLDYAAEYPYFGGGFYAYLDNAGELSKYATTGETLESNKSPAKAFHNMFFEVLGELGYMGLFIYLLFIYKSLRSYWRLKHKRENEDWFNNLISMLLISTLGYIVGGMFVGIAYLPYLYFLLFAGVSLSNISQTERARNTQCSS